VKFSLKHLPAHLTFMASPKLWHCIQYAPVAANEMFKLGKFWQSITAGSDRLRVTSVLRKVSEY